MPTHPRSYSPAAADKLRRALLALAAAATAVAAGPGCTLSGARPQQPDESVPPVEPRIENPQIDDPDSIRAEPQTDANANRTVVFAPRLSGVPIPCPQPDPPPAAGSVPGASTTGSARALPPKEGCSVYTVQPGDTLSAIARRHGVRLKSIVEANSIADPDRIREKQQLYIPTE